MSEKERLRGRERHKERNKASVKKKKTEEGKNTIFLIRFGNRPRLLKRTKTRFVGLEIPSSNNAINY